MTVFEELRAILHKHKENMPVIVVAELLAEIDEAEADVCVWKHKEYHTNCFCGHNEGYAEHDFVIGWNFCPYCGKPIKISEVE